VNCQWITKDLDANILFLADVMSCIDVSEREAANYQLNFCVKKYFIPEPLISCGKAPVNPKESGNQAVSHFFPNLDSKYL
jgi:hypothetical protein